jgi:hypothetical protein
MNTNTSRANDRQDGEEHPLSGANPASDRGPRARFSRASGVYGAVLAMCVSAASFAACTDPGGNLFPTGTGDPGGPGGPGGTGGSGGSGGSGGGPIVVVPIKPAPAGVRRLIGRQYIGSIRTLLGAVAADAASPPADPQLSGLEAIAATDLATPPSSVEAYEVSARAIATAAVTDPPTLAKILPCVPNGFSDYGCLKEFVTQFGHQAWRRPLTDVEATRITAAGKIAADAFQTFEMGLEAAMSAILQSPYFLYMVELGVPDAMDPTVRRLTGPEMATRMSFFLVNSTPDAALLDSAEKGGLDTDEGVRAAAEQLLLRPEAKAALAAFYEEIYHLRDLVSMQKDPVLFPELNDSLRASMREETLRLVEDVVWTRDADASELLTANFTFVNPELAALYGVQAPPPGQFVKVSLPADQKRAGLLGQASYLARGAHDKFTSPTRRGAFVREALLCDPVDPPPPTVNPVLPDDGMPKPVKDKLIQHMNDPTCSGCHELMDPIGFALEHFDALGKYRLDDQGFAIDPTAQIDDIGSFASAQDLGALLANDPRTAQCTMKKLFRH